MESNQAEQQKISKNEARFSHLWDNIKHTNIYIIGLPEGEEREKGCKKEIIAENISNLKKEIDIHFQEAETALNKMNPRMSTRHIIKKMSEIKDRQS